MSQAQATKTLRQPLEQRAGISEWFTTTQELFNQVAAFYFQVLDAHPGVLDLSSKDVLTTMERLTHATAQHPSPLMPVSAVAAQVPSYFRRAAIRAALGAMRSFQSHRARWQRAQAKAEAKGKPCQVRPPVPPRKWNRSVVLYAGMWKQPAAGRIALKLYDGQTWRLVRFRVFGREVPTDWQAGSPQLVQHGQRWWVHVPVSQALAWPKKVETQVTTQPDARVCAVDLNLNDALAVCTIQRADGTVLASRFVRGGDELHGPRQVAPWAYCSPPASDWHSRHGRAGQQRFVGQDSTSGRRQGAPAEPPHRGFCLRARSHDPSLRASGLLPP